MEIRAGTIASLGFNMGCADHLAPFLGFVGDQLAKVGGRARKDGPAQLGEPYLDRGICKPGVDDAVELVDDLSRCVSGRPKTLPTACFITRDELTDGRGVRQQVEALTRRHRQRAQLAGPDLLAIEPATVPK